MRRTLLVLLLLLSACGTNANQPTSSAGGDGAAAGPTARPTRELPTPRPRPEGTPSGGQPPGQGDNGAALAKMIQRTMTAEQYVMDRDYSSVTSSTSAEGLHSTSTQEIKIQIQTSGETRRYVSLAEDSPMDLITTAGDEAYLRGPMPEMGAPEDRWYSASSSDMEMAMLLLLVGTSPPSTQVLMIPNQELGGFEQLRSEDLDGLSCTVYQSEELARLVASVPQISPSSPTGNGFVDPSFFSSAELLVWGCEDGYIHRIEHHASGEQGDERRTIDELLTFSQLGGPVAIELPTDALPLEQ